MKRLFDETGDEMINQLVDKIVDGSYDWFSVYEKFRYKKPASTYLSRGIINSARKWAQTPTENGNTAQCRKKTDERA